MQQSLYPSMHIILSYTQQQLADSLGLRVETVTRAVKKLEERGQVQMVKRKIYLAS